MTVILWVAAGGAVGSVLRYVISDAIDRRAAPWGTVLVNLVGSLALGILVGWFARRSTDSVVRIALGVGFLGGFTTFSSWAVETLALLDSGKLAAAVGNVVVSVVAGLAAAGIGLDRSIDLRHQPATRRRVMTNIGAATITPSRSVT